MAYTAPYAHHCPKTCLAAPLRHTRQAPLKHTASASARERFTRAPPAHGRIIRAARAAHVGMRHVVGLQDAPAHCPATGGAAGQHRKGAISVRQEGHYVATCGALRRVSGAECAQGVVRALRGRLRGTASAVPKIAGSSVKAHLRLADCLHQEVGHANSVEGGNLPPSNSLGRHIEGPNATCNNGRARSERR
jgi:hypothetical protein